MLCEPRTAEQLRILFLKELDEEIASRGAVPFRTK